MVGYQNLRSAGPVSEESRGREMAASPPNNTPKSDGRMTEECVRLRSQHGRDPVQASLGAATRPARHPRNAFSTRTVAP